jgi:hypothetical protein
MATAAAATLSNKLDATNQALLTKHRALGKQYDYLQHKVATLEKLMAATEQRVKRTEQLHAVQADHMRKQAGKIDTLLSEVVDLRRSAGPPAHGEVSWPLDSGDGHPDDLQEEGQINSVSEQPIGAGGLHLPVHSAKLPPLPMYKHGNVDNHFNLLETYFRLAHTPAALHIDYALMSMPSVMSFWHMYAARNPARVHWTAFKETVATYLQGTRHTNQALGKLLRCKQNAQSASAYAKYFLQLVQDSNTDPSEAWLISHFVMGLSDSHLRRTLASNNGDTWTDVLQLIQHLTKIVAYEDAARAEGSTKHYHATQRMGSVGAHRKPHHFDRNRNRSHHAGGGFKRDRGSAGLGDGGNASKKQWGKPGHQYGQKPPGASAHNNKFSNGAGGSRGPGPAKLNTLQVSIEPLAAQLNALSVQDAHVAANKGLTCPAGTLPTQDVAAVVQDQDAQQHTATANKALQMKCLRCGLTNHWTHRCTKLRSIFNTPGCRLCSRGATKGHEHTTAQCPLLHTQVQQYINDYHPDLVGAMSVDKLLAM